MLSRMPREKGKTGEACTQGIVTKVDRIRRMAGSYEEGKERRRKDATYLG